MGPLPPSLWKHLATLGFIGYLPIAPGTFGTLAAALFFWLCSLPLLVHLIVIVFVTVIGALAAHEAEKVFNRRDPGEIVIDEFAGYAVSLLFVPSTPLYLAAAFLLFRFFDILKPPPIRRVEIVLPGGLGVMADDILAGAYANGVLQLWMLLIRN